MIKLKYNKLSQYTESEFVELLDEIASANGGEEYQDSLLHHFIDIVPHPESSDLIYWPEDGDTSNANIISKIRQHCEANNLSYFRNTAR